jgi:membrane dipeptidase|tara:strand:- start:1370 stop:2461 length:1092 start_codon:yes stop_codon:yes gene_type:complete
MKGTSFLVLSVLILLVGCDRSLERKAIEMSLENAIIDTHIDTPYRLYKQQMDTGSFEDITRRTSIHFDLPRALEGGLNVPFFAIYVPAVDETNGVAFDTANKVIDFMNAIIEENDRFFYFVRSPEDIDKSTFNKKVGIAYGMENGGPLEGKLERLKYFADKGISYITLTHSKSNHISDSSYDETRQWDGLSPFGVEVVKEMNRLGMMIDISHVSDEAFFQVLELSSAPTVATHSSLRHFVPDFERNVSDEMMIALAKNDGVLQLNFGDYFIRDVRNNPDLKVTIADVVDHVDRVVDLVGIDHIGIGSDYDGIPRLPVGLEDVSTYPQFIKELLVRGYSDEDIKKIMNGNILRVWKEVRRLAND